MAKDYTESELDLSADVASMDTEESETVWDDDYRHDRAGAPLLNMNRKHYAVLHLHYDGFFLGAVTKEEVKYFAMDIYNDCMSKWSWVDNSHMANMLVSFLCSAISSCKKYIDTGREVETHQPQFYNFMWRAYLMLLVVYGAHKVDPETLFWVFEDSVDYCFKFNQYIDKMKNSTGLDYGCLKLSLSA